MGECGSIVWGQGGVDGFEFPACLSFSAGGELLYTGREIINRVCVGLRALWDGL